MTDKIAKMPAGQIRNKKSLDWRLTYFSHLIEHKGEAADQLKRKALVKAQCIYRYRPLSGYGLTELITGRIHMAKPEQLNDPYERALRLNVLGNYPHKLGSAYGAFHYFPSETRIASFCETPKRLTMWAHYANRPTGCCLEYKTAELLTHDHIIRGLHPAIYESRLFDADISLMNQSEHLGQVLVRAACHKLTSWRHEREWRLVDIRFTTPDSSPWHDSLPPASIWAPKFNIEEQSQVVGVQNKGEVFITLPPPSRIILFGDQLDAEEERLIRGISRLASVPLALAQITPDATPGKELKIQNL